MNVRYAQHQGGILRIVAKYYVKILLEKPLFVSNISLEAHNGELTTGKKHNGIQKH